MKTNLASKSSLVSSNNNTIQEVAKIVVVWTFASHPNNNYSPILVDPSSPFQLPSVWEKMNFEALRRPDVKKLTIPRLAENLWENEDQPCLLSSKSCLVSSNNNTTIHQPKQKAEKIVVVRTFASHPDNYYSPILLDPSSPFRLPSVWEKINSEDLRRPDVTKLTLAGSLWENEDQPCLKIQFGIF